MALTFYEDTSRSMEHFREKRSTSTRRLSQLYRASTRKQLYCHKTQPCCRPTPSDCKKNEDTGELDIVRRGNATINPLPTTSVAFTRCSVSRCVHDDLSFENTSEDRPSSHRSAEFVCTFANEGKICEYTGNLNIVDGLECSMQSTHQL